MHALFGLDRCALVGMVHALPLPGSPRWRGSFSEVVDAAVRDAEALQSGGCDAVIVENMHDLPYLRGAVPPETTAAMAVVTRAVVSTVALPVGVQVLAAANRAALGVAVAADADFIRAEAFAYGHLADEGWLDATAGELLRVRRALDAERIAVWADVKKKHASHSATSDLSLRQMARGTAFCGADALIVTGVETGGPARVDDVRAAALSGLPVAVGSGVDADRAATFAAAASALIVGTALKVDGDWRQPVDQDRVRAVRDAMKV